MNRYARAIASSPLLLPLFTTLLASFLLGSLTTVAETSAKPAAPRVLLPFTATYEAKFSGFAVKAERTLSGNPQSWRLDFSANSMFAKIEEYSRFAQEGLRLIPQHYDYQKSGLGRDRHTALSFENDGKRVVNIYNKSRSIEKAPANIQDKISYQMQLAIDVANGKQPLKYLVADGKKIREYEFEVAGKETVKTPMGDIQTIKVQRIRDEGAQRVTNIWFAPEWNYALVKLMQREENGKSYQITLTKLLIDGKEISNKK
ncbi:DUF3108 domain-containing protein [Microbulbifer agarilyticus]|uniref:DUF3108 domain-containing protein n=1 Tax=Microbulbifer agarilyticus TaxID=260552 RepID=UPI0021BBC63E|nr:DUF3108 domain-containing protein [Microbulbifer agarilyticus]